MAWSTWRRHKNVRSDFSVSEAAFTRCASSQSAWSIRRWCCMWDFTALCLEVTALCSEMKALFVPFVKRFDWIEGDVIGVRNDGICSVSCLLWARLTILNLDIFLQAGIVLLEDSSISIETLSTVLLFVLSEARHMFVGGLCLDWGLRRWFRLPCDSLCTLMRLSISGGLCLAWGLQRIPGEAAKARAECKAWGELVQRAADLARQNLGPPQAWGHADSGDVQGYAAERFVVAAEVGLPQHVCLFHPWVSIRRVTALGMPGAMEILVICTGMHAAGSVNFAALASRRISSSQNLILFPFVFF